MIKSVLYFDRLARIFGDIEEDKIILFQIISQEEEGMEWLGKNVDILHLQEISINGIDGIHCFLIKIYNIQSEKYFAGFSDDMLLLLAIDMDVIDVDHNPFPIYVIMFLRRLALFLYDILEILKGEFFFKFLKYIESEKWEPAFVEHEVMGVFGIFPWFVCYLDQILMKHILQNLILFAYLVDTEARMRFRQMLISYIKQTDWITG